MIPALLAVLAPFRSLFRGRAALQAELIALRHPLLILERPRAGRRVALRTSDRLLWAYHLPDLARMASRSRPRPAGDRPPLHRQYLPKRTSMPGVTQQQCNGIATKLSRRPRKRLGFKTPEECFYG